MQYVLVGNTRYVAEALLPARQGERNVHEVAKSSRSRADVSVQTHTNSDTIPREK